MSGGLPGLVRDLSKTRMPPERSHVSFRRLRTCLPHWLAPLGADFVAKVFFALVIKIFFGCTRDFRVKMLGGPHRLTINSRATSVT